MNENIIENNKEKIVNNNIIINNFFKTFEEKIQIDESEKSKIKNDFINAMLFYINKNYTVEESVKLLDVQNMGKFYFDKKKEVYELDDFAKIILPLNNSKFTFMFRISIYLTEEIVPELLQIALNFTIDKYPLFATRLKKYKNKYFFETHRKHYIIEQEDEIPCKPIDLKNEDSQLFRVLYFKNKISLEVFHVLTDGMGAITFLKTLVWEYLKLVEKNMVKIENIDDKINISQKEEMVNPFENISINKKESYFENIKFLKIKGERIKNKPYEIINIKLDSTKLKNISKKYNTTVTGYLTSVMFLANQKATNNKKGYTNVYIPINLRPYYPTNSIRNFCTLCNIYIENEKNVKFSSIVEKVNTQLKNTLVPDKITQLVVNTKKIASLSENIPFKINKVTSKITCKVISNNYFTNVLSNLGEIKFTNGISNYVVSMEAFMNISIIAKIACGVITVNNITTFSILKNIDDKSFEEVLYKQFFDDGIIIKD